MAKRVRRVLDRHALGGGAEVAIAAHIRIAVDDVRIGFNQVTLAIMPAWGGAERLAQLVGRGRALLARAAGELSDARTAHALGLVDLVVPRAEFDERWASARRRHRGACAGHVAGREAVVAPAAPAVHRELEDSATDAFARL